VIESYYSRTSLKGLRSWFKIITVRLRRVTLIEWHILGIFDPCSRFPAVLHTQR